MAPMLEDDVQLEETEVGIFPTPLCDEDDELAEAVREADAVDSGDEDVEAHGGGGFNDAA